MEDKASPLQLSGKYFPNNSIIGKNIKKQGAKVWEKTPQNGE